VRSTRVQLDRSLLGGSFADAGVGTDRAEYRVRTAPIFGAPSAVAKQATGWDKSSDMATSHEATNHMATTNAPRPLDLPGGSTG